MNLVTLFNQEITEQGLLELSEKYQGVVMDMNNDDDFKQARKIRTEQNKLTKAINDRRIDLTKQLKEQGDALVNKVVEIYEPIVDAFEAEDKRRKELAAEEKRKHDEMMQAEQAKLNNITNLVHRARGQHSQYIAEMIESIDLIDETDFHKDIIHEAIKAKKDATAELTQMLADAKAREQLEQEQAKLKVQERINNLQMIPSTMFGKSSNDIESKINSIRGYDITESEFFERVDEVKNIVTTVITQLSQMLEQAKFMEQNQASQAAVSAPKETPPEQEAQPLTKQQKLDNWCLMYDVSQQALDELMVIINEQ